MVISSDGHATARMPDYAAYLDPAFREEFTEFCAAYARAGSPTPSKSARSPSASIRTSSTSGGRT